MRATGRLQLVGVDEVPRVEGVLRHAEHLLLPRGVEVAELPAVRIEPVLGLGVDAHHGQALFAGHAEALRAGVVEAQDGHIAFDGLGDGGLVDDRGLPHPVASHGVVDGVAVRIDARHVVLAGVGRGCGRRACRAARRGTSFAAGRTALGSALFGGSPALGGCGGRLLGKRGAGRRHGGDARSSQEAAARKLGDVHVNPPRSMFPGMRCIPRHDGLRAPVSGLRTSARPPRPHAAPSIAPLRPVGILHS